MRLQKKGVDVPVGVFYCTGHVVAKRGLLGRRAIERLAELRLREIRAHERHEKPVVVIETTGAFFVPRSRR